MAEIYGIFGGTFDPPHLGHLILAAEALNQLKLSKVLWVLTPQPPHKPDRPITILHHRYEMLKRTVGSVPGFEISTVEMDRPGPHYTIDTLDILQERHPNIPLMLLIGADSLNNLHNWHKPDELITAVYGFGVMRRPDQEIDLKAIVKTLPDLAAKIRYIETPQLEISSTTIRQRIASGGHYRFYLPAAVYDYIQQNKLYR